MGKRIKDITISEQTKFEPKLRLLVDKMDSDAGIYPWWQAKNIQLKHLGNAYFEGSNNNSTWHFNVLPTDTYIRFSSDAGLNWRDFSTKNVREDTNLYFTEARVLGISDVANAITATHVHTNWDVLQNIIDSGDGLSFLNNAGEYTSILPEGTGDVVGPVSSVNNNIVLFDGVTGKLIKDGGTLGTAAFDDSGDFATAAQGDLADTAVQGTPWTGMGYLTSLSGAVLTSDLTVTTGASISGINTGDQDLSSYATLTGSETLTNKDLTATSNKLFKTGTVATAAATTAKTVTLDAPDASYTPENGDLFLFTYTSGQTASSATLAVNGGAAKAVRLGNATANNIGHTTASGGSLLYRYDGTYFQLIGSQQQINTNTTYIESTTGTAVTGATQTAAVSNLYYANNATTVAFTLPVTCALNSVVEIVGLHATGTWSVIAPSGDNIIINGNDTGAAGTLTGAIRSTVKLRCIVANTTWEVVHYTGVIVTNTSYSTASIGVALATSVNGATIITEAPQTISYSATPTHDFNSGYNSAITLTGDITTYTLTNVPSGGGGEIAVIQDGTGGYGIAAFAHTGLTVYYIDSTLPTSANINSGADAHTILSYKRIGSYLYITFGKFGI